MKLTFYTIVNEVGGEYIFLERISKKLNGNLLHFFDKTSKRAEIKPNSITGKLFYALYLSADLLGHLFPYEYFLYDFPTFFYKISGDVTIFSTALAGIPRGKVITLFMTSNRRFTIDYEEIIREYRRYGAVKVTLFRLLRNIYIFLFKRSLKNSVLNISISENVRKRVLKYYGINSYVIPVSIDVAMFKCESYQNYFLYVSRLSKKKRQDYALRVFNLFHNKRQDFKLYIAFPMPRSKDEIDYYAELQGYLSDHQLPVEFKLGLPYSDILKLYSNSYACIFCAEDEDSGLVPLEAMASEKPIISVNEGGPKETIIDGVTGFLVNNEKEMAEKMELLASNIDLTMKMGKAGRQHVSANFDDSLIVERWRKLVFERLNVEI